MHEHLHIPPIYTHGPFLGRELVSICRGNEAFEQKLVENEANIWRNVPLAGGGQGKQANRATAEHSLVSAFTGEYSGVSGLKVNKVHCYDIQRKTQKDPKSPSRYCWECPIYAHQLGREV